MISEIRADNGVVWCSVTVEKEKVDSIFQEVYREAGQSIKIPGFRRGRAPVNVLRARLDMQEIKRLVADRLIPSAVDEILEKYEIKPLEAPVLRGYDLEEGADLLFRFIVVEAPEVELGEHKGLAIGLPEAPDARARAQEVLEKSLEEDAQYEPKQTSEVGVEDVVEVHLECRVGDKLRLLREKARLTLSDPGLNPALRDNLVGSEIGEEREFEADLSTGKGKELAHYSMKVEGIFEKKLPELTNAWARRRFGYETVEEVLQRLEDRIAEEHKRVALDELKLELLGRVCEASKVDIPTHTLVRGVSSELQQFADELRDRGFSLDETGASTAELVDEIVANAVDRARQGIKEDLVISEIARREGLEVSEEELERRVGELGFEFEDSRSRAAVRARLKAQMERTRVLDFLYESAVTAPKEAEGEEAAVTDTSKDEADIERQSEEG